MAALAALAVAAGVSSAARAGSSERVRPPLGVRGKPLPLAPPPTIQGFAPGSGPSGTTVTIHGTAFDGSTAVRFNGSPSSSVTVVSSTTVTAVVPDGAGTGPVSVQTSGGTATSLASFVVMLSAPPPTTVPGHGTPLWMKWLPGAQASLARAIAISPDGSRVFVTGYHSGIYGTVAYKASNGAQLWLKTYEPVSGPHDATAITVSPDGSEVFVTGKSDVRPNPSDPQNYDYATIAYRASDGTQLWVARYDDRANDVPVAIRVSPDGSKVFVTGTTDTLPGGSPHLVTVAYNTNTGAQLWVQQYSTIPPTGTSLAASGLAVSPDSSTVYVGGWAYDQGIDDYVAIAYDTSNGSERWLAHWDGINHLGGEARAMALSPDGSTLYLTGDCRPPSGSSNFDYGTVAFSTAAGTQLWAATYDGPAHNGDEASAVTVSPDNSRVYVTGAVSVPGETPDGLRNYNLDFGTIAYTAADGTRLWVQLYNGPWSFDDGANAIAVSPNGAKVFVTGMSEAQQTYGDLTTLSYDTKTGGGETWLQRFNGVNNLDDVGTGIVVSPDSSTVYVTGSNGRDGYETIAYSS